MAPPGLPMLATKLSYLNKLELTKNKGANAK
jgi:hypothetical protein